MIVLINSTPAHTTVILCILTAVLQTSCAVKNRYTQSNLQIWYFQTMGPDGISARMLKSVAKTIPSPLTRLFNLSLSSGVVPDSWSQRELILFLFQNLHRADHLPATIDLFLFYHRLVSSWRVMYISFYFITFVRTIRSLADNGALNSTWKICTVSTAVSNAWLCMPSPSWKQ